jgi:hypothetical protein
MYRKLVLAALTGMGLVGASSRADAGSFSISIGGWGAPAPVVVPAPRIATGYVGGYYDGCGVAAPVVAPSYYGGGVIYRSYPEYRGYRAPFHRGHGHWGHGHRGYRGR